MVEIINLYPGILEESGEDFESPDDLNDAIGAFLSEVSPSETTIREACKALFASNR